MSALLIESTPVETASAGRGTDASQLFFDFEPVCEIGPSASRNPSTQTARFPAVERVAVLPVTVPEKFTEDRSRAGSCVDSGDSIAEVVSSAGRRRSLGQPVRIGTVMLKLLKSYGITDDEIQAGLADFAQGQTSGGQALANAS